jgi:hypothetical protein
MSHLGVVAGAGGGNPARSGGGQDKNGHGAVQGLLGTDFDLGLAWCLRQQGRPTAAAEVSCCTPCSGEVATRARKTRDREPSEDCGEELRLLGWLENGL